MALPRGLSKSFLSLNRDYFRMRKPLERRIYELARKHCGRQDQWRVSVEVLHRKSGSASPRRVFRAMLREMIEADALPDYHLEEEPGDILRVTPRDAVIEAAGRPMLASATYEAAREMRPGWDVYALEAEWRAWWVETGRPRLARPTRRSWAGWRARPAARPDAAPVAVLRAACYANFTALARDGRRPRGQGDHSVNQADPVQRRAPDFFLVGAPKSATSSLHKLLIRHPGCSCAIPRSRISSARICPDWPRCPIATPMMPCSRQPPRGPNGAMPRPITFLSSTLSAREIHAANPDARIIAVDPQSRSMRRSRIYHQLRDGFREDQPSFEAAWRLQDARARGEHLPSYCPEPRQLQYRERLQLS
jgi:hypothetical protein